MQISLAVMSLCQDSETTAAAACDTASHDAICKFFITAFIALIHLYKRNVSVLANLQLAPIWNGIFTWNIFSKTSNIQAVVLLTFPNVGIEKLEM